MSTNGIHEKSSKAQEVGKGSSVDTMEGRICVTEQF